MKPKVLLTNDDGVNSAGLWAAYEALAQIADVSVVAPSTQQSAVGRSISIFEPIRATKISINGVHAYSVGGKPTDSVIIGIYALGIKPDLVVSGINIGENLSFESIMTSGTIGAALEAANHGFPAVAFSLQVEDQADKFDDPSYFGHSFDESKQMVREICENIFEGGFPENMDLINVNIPKKVTSGTEITRLAEKLFETGVEKRLDPRGKPYYWINGPLYDHAEEGTDVNAVANGKVSVTPITLDSTSFEGMEPLKKLFRA
jgi:5'-nucleotidase